MCAALSLQAPSWANTQDAGDTPHLPQGVESDSDLSWLIDELADTSVFNSLLELTSDRHPLTGMPRSTAAGSSTPIQLGQQELMTQPKQAAKAFKSGIDEPRQFELPTGSQPRQAAKAFKSGTQAPRQFELPTGSQPRQAAKAFKSGTEAPRQFDLQKKN
jgi:hypothetical protein